MRTQSSYTSGSGIQRQVRSYTDCLFVYQRQYPYHEKWWLEERRTDEMIHDSTTEGEDDHLSNGNGPECYVGRYDCISFRRSVLTGREKVMIHTFGEVFRVLHLRDELRIRESRC